MACWWGLAYVIVAAFCWPIFSNPRYACEDAATCTKDNNMVRACGQAVTCTSKLTDFKGWRYIWYGNGTLVFICSILRVTVIRLRETPKYLLTKGEDAAVVEIFQDIAKKYHRPCHLSLEELESLGTINSTYGKSRYGFGEFWAHISGLFATRKLAISTLMIWLSWLLIGTIIQPPNLLFSRLAHLNSVSRVGISAVLCIPS